MDDERGADAMADTKAPPHPQPAPYEPPAIRVVASVQEATLGVTEAGSDSLSMFS